MTNIPLQPETLRRLDDGPLAPHIGTFEAWLSDQNYSRYTAGDKLRQVADLNHWLRRRDFGLAKINEQRLIQFCQSRYGKNTGHGVESTMRALLVQLRHADAIPPAAVSSDNPLLRIERGFGEYLVQTCGLSWKTLKRYLPPVKLFLAWRFGKKDIRPQNLRPSDTTRFILRHARPASPNYAKGLTKGLSSFFRYLRFAGKTTRDMAASVPAVANWRLSALPETLSSGDVQRLLKDCDQNSPVGRRNYAILLLLCRLGLRAGEVAALTLDDIDWEAGELVIRGKGGRTDRLPLPSDVGEAMVSYLRRVRPQCHTRRFFVRVKAPYEGFRSYANVSEIVCRALARSGLSPSQRGAHILRHSLATQMLRKGASLTEIGQIFRHRNLFSSQIYAKVDLTALRPLGQPWPRISL
ncbi:MAG: site-specific integrase [Elusimicrobiota bacterium]|nr:site-specific integrase [Elusimicrobiota bacterium]